MLFGRVASVEIGPPGKTGFRIEGLKIAFEVEKTDTRTSNVSRVEITNLSEATRGKIREVDDTLILRAGYSEDGGEQLLAMGSITHVVHRRQPPDIITTIEAGDGIRERREIRVSLAFAPGVRGKQVLDEIARKMGLVVRAIETFDDKSYAQGFAFVGQAKEALDRVTDNLALEWSIQNGQVQILKRGSTNRTTAPLISPQTGLIGSPEPVVDVGQGLSKVSVKTGYRLSVLLMPSVEPGQRVKVEAAELKGVYRVRSVKHTGDTHGDEWRSDIEVAEKGHEGPQKHKSKAVAKV